MTGHQLDLHAAQSLYWEAVPFALQSTDRDKRVCAMTVRLLTGTDRHNPALRTLRLNLSSEEDLLFLHTLEVTEEDFQTLKVDQGILVDYGSFPAKVISLLQRCLACSNDKQPRFQATLTCYEGTSVLRVVETNDFNQLPHITLRFQPGDDAAIKKFLAFRLAEVKADLGTTAAALSTSQGEASSAKAALQQSEQILQDAARQHETCLVKQEADIQSREAAMLHSHTQEVAALREHMDRERSEARHRHDDASASASSRITELEAQNRQLSDAKTQLEAKASELSCRLGMSEGSVRALEDEAASLKSMAKEVAEERPRRMAEAADLAARLRSAEERAEAQQRTIEEQADHAHGLQASIRNWEDRCGELKAASTVHESRAHALEGEGLSSAQVLDRLQGEVRSLKEKLKRKGSSLTAAQQEVAAKEAELEAAALHVRRMAHQEQLLQEDLASNKEQLAGARSKLEEAKEQIQSSEQMVRWLNIQVNEAQAQLGSTGLMSARYGHMRSVSPSQLPSVSLARTLGKAAAATGSLHLPLPSSPSLCARGKPLTKASLQGRTFQSKSLEQIWSRTQPGAGEPGCHAPAAPASVHVQA